ncbi:DUF4185 domain-containing protein [Stieleria sp. JC731]|uniref:DUF4185 domain-containing protein n=1 Tax=Pirellulaceae TaxID=2691357 RepID=UPI001E3DCA4A|nr:DUF4185 domain-containing protein [Stieleria sp. JC731]MCC9598956.1 DUF4185 domain-containing protein [Stieleria sp. JC731]
MIRHICGRPTLAFLTLSLACLIAPQGALAIEPCRIRVVDAQDGWPVPLVELRTTHHVRFVTDNAGVVAFDLPELMDTQIWLTVQGHGYNVPKDGFGYRGVRVTPTEGGEITIKVNRELPARRLGRITGGGLFAESQKLGEHLDWKEQRILGCDSVQNAIYQGKTYWAWGDTTLASYPLGRFNTIGASSVIQPLDDFQPPIKLRYDYFTDDDGVPRNVAPMPGKGPTWLMGYASLPDAAGKEHLVATYSKIEPPLAEYEVGLCVWNDATNYFEQAKVIWEKSRDQSRPRPTPQGHAVIWKDDNAKQWALFGDPLPTLRCEATFESWSDPSTWELLEPQHSIPAKNSGESIRPHRGAIAWNAYRKKWVTVFTQFGGDMSHLGELWYAEADSPMGPWGDAIKVVTHDKYTFYNPQLHPEFTENGSPILLFQATYTYTFSSTSDPTPRHDYNQVLYRLDLDQLVEKE